jgi:hypothetical protein
MTTLEKLMFVKDLTKISEEILNEIEIDFITNKSLNEYYGYSLDKIKSCFTTDANLNEIIEQESFNWVDNSDDDENTPENYLQYICDVNI